MAPKRKPDSQAPPAAPAKKKPNRRRKLRYTVRKKTSKISSSASPRVKKVKNEEKEDKTPTKEVDVEVVEAVKDKSGSVYLIIEHCKQCTSFKNQAAVFEKSLKDKIQDIEISINPAKPRRGCFEVRDEEGNLFVSLLDLKRPFPALKALNVEEQVEKIVSKIKK